MTRCYIAVSMAKWLQLLPCNSWTQFMGQILTKHETVLYIHSMCCKLWATALKIHDIPKSLCLKSYHNSRINFTFTPLHCYTDWRKLYYPFIYMTLPKPVHHSLIMHTLTLVIMNSICILLGSWINSHISMSTSWLNNFHLHDNESFQTHAMKLCTADISNSTEVLCLYR